jgi:hypothetical protein
MQPQKMSHLEPMAWTRGRVAYDPIGHKALPQGKTMQIIVVQLGLHVTATGVTSY